MAFDITPDMPDFSQCEAVRVYKIGNHTALLVENPPMLGRRLDNSVDPSFDIKYIFAMVVYEDKELKLIITSEVTSNALIDVAPEHIKADLLKPSLCTYNGAGVHDNYGKVKDWSDVETFCQKGFDIIKDIFKISETPVAMQRSGGVCVNKAPAGSIAAKIIKWHFGKLILLWIIAVVSFLVVKNDARMFGRIDISAGRYLEIAPAILTIYILIIIYLTWIWISALESKSNK